MFVFSKGVAANCASALAQMAAASCVQEEKEEKETQEPSDAIAQGSDRKARIHLEPHVRSAHTSRHMPPCCICDTRHIVYTTDDETLPDHRLTSVLWADPPDAQ